MEGKVDPGVKNWLAKHRSFEQRIEAHDVMQSLIDHPGWQLMDEIVEELRLRGFESIASSTSAEHHELASRLGFQNGMAFHRDVVASVIDSAKTAAAELKKTADLDRAAGGR